jgi:acetate kinase
MKILVFNSGSSSIKFQLISIEEETEICKGIVEKIGSSSAILNYVPLGGTSQKIVQEILDHDTATKIIVEALTDKKTGVIKDVNEIRGIGHRVVHGGEAFSKSVLITKEVKEIIKECIDLAPLHNPPNLKGIEACEKFMPGIDQVAVFDTAFHQKMEPSVYMYALPYSMYSKYKIRRYGFHGTSHRYVTQKATQILGIPYENPKMISCHLGNGSSIAAVKNGTSVDTSMGFTPLEGLIMGTRCGDIDPAIITYIMRCENLTIATTNFMMNKHSGVYGISGGMSDMREVEAQMAAGNPRCQLAHDMFTYRIKKYIGAYATAMGGLDVLIFTGGIGENSSMVRQNVCKELEFLGITIDSKKNKKNENIISKDKVNVMVIPTNEELLIARDTAEIIKPAKK